MTIVAVYRPPSTTTDGTTRMLNMLSRASEACPSLIVVGDANIDLMRQSAIRAQWESTCADLGLEQLTTTGTYRQPHRDDYESAIDHVLIRLPVATTKLQPRHVGSMSDGHHVVGVSVRIGDGKAQQQRHYTSRRLGPAELDAARALLASMPLAWSVEQEQSITAKAAVLQDSVMAALDIVAPETTKLERRRRAPWRSKAVDDQLRKRNVMHKRWWTVRHSRQPVVEKLRKAYVAARNKASSTLKNARITYFTVMAEKARANPTKSAKEFWSRLRNELEMRSPLSSQPIDDHNGRSIPPGGLADALCERYTIPGCDPDDFVIPVGEEPTFVPKRRDGSAVSPGTRVARFSFTVPTVPDVGKLLRATKVAKSPGPDGLPARLVKYCAAELALPFHLVWKECISRSIYPDIWKLARICPVPKTPCPTSTKEFRPISIINLFPRIIEAENARQLSSFYEQHGLFPVCQCGFRKRHSPESACLRLTEEIRRRVDNNEYVVAVALDVERAFESVDRKLLLERLAADGIGASALAWLKCFLSGRRHFVRINGNASESMATRLGVPQGSPVSCFLFLAFVGDLPGVVKRDSGNDTSLFADDSFLFASSRSIGEAVDRVNTGLAVAAEWYSASKLRLHPAKSEGIVFGKRGKLRGLDVPAILLNGTVVQRKPIVKHLGVNIDEHLDFNRHINQARGRASLAAALIARHKRNLPLSTKSLLHKALVLPHLDYAGCVWDSATAAAKSTLDVVQNDSLRSASGLRRRDCKRIDDLLAEHDLQPLGVRRALSTLQHVHAVELGTAPKVVSELFARREHSHSTRRATTFVHVSGRSAILHDGFVGRGVRAYEELFRQHPAVCRAPTVASFRKRFLEAKGYAKTKGGRPSNAAAISTSRDSDSSLTSQHSMLPFPVVLLH